MDPSLANPLAPLVASQIVFRYLRVLLDMLSLSSAAPFALLLPYLPAMWSAPLIALRCRHCLLPCWLLLLFASFGFGRRHASLVASLLAPPFGPPFAIRYLGVALCPRRPPYALSSVPM